MRVLHYYPDEDPMVSQHVTMLSDGMGLEADNHLATDFNGARTLLQGTHYDILHLHGCWRNSSRTVVNMALKARTRLVLTPHGQLEPWMMEECRWKEKLPKQMLYQRNIVKRAYAVIIQGKMEQECMQQLGWNPRTVIIRNCVVTSSITKKEMARQTFALYQKVMDSNPLELMQKGTLQALRTIIKAGITGDTRWLTEEDILPTMIQWRELLCYAYQEQIAETIQRGIRILGLDAPDIDVEQIPFFAPSGFQQADAIGLAIGNQFVSEDERLLATFRYLRKLASSHQLGIKHLIELDRELREHDCEESTLMETLAERNLSKHVARLMQLMQDLTGLTEGYMPTAPVNDRTTRLVRKQIDNHLKI